MRTRLAVWIVLMAGCGSLFAGLQEKPDRKLLEVAWPLESLSNLLVPGSEWRPYPTVSDSAGLDAVPQNIRAAHISRGEALLDAQWPPLPASVFLDYVRNGNRSRFQALSFDRREKLAQLVLAELFERRGRFMDQIVDGVWAICEESFWGVPAHLGGQKAGHGLPDVTDPYVDLFAAETGALMAWVNYLLAPQFDEINPLIAKRIELEIDRRILSPYMQHDDWGWMGFRYRNRTGYERPVNNWNPWINSNVLACALLIEKDEARRQELVFKTMQSIDNFIEPYPADGGCDEGPSYWNRAGGALFDYLSLLSLATHGRVSVFDQPLIQEMGRYIYRVYISDPWFINFADASAKLRVNPDIVYRYGKAIGDETMMRFAAFTAQKEGYGQGALKGSYGGLNRILPALFHVDELLNTPPQEPAVGIAVCAQADSTSPQTKIGSAPIAKKSCKMRSMSASAPSATRVIPTSLSRMLCPNPEPPSIVSIVSSSCTTQIKSHSAKNKIRIMAKFSTSPLASIVHLLHVNLL